MQREALLSCACSIWTPLSLLNKLQHLPRAQNLSPDGLLEVFGADQCHRFPFCGRDHLGAACDHFSALLIEYQAVKSDSSAPGLQSADCELDRKCVSHPAPVGES